MYLADTLSRNYAKSSEGTSFDQAIALNIDEIEI